MEARRRYKVTRRGSLRSDFVVPDAPKARAGTHLSLVVYGSRVSPYRVEDARERA